MQIDVTDRWHAAFPGGHVGVLLMGDVDNTPRATPLDQRKRALEARLRQTYAHYARADFHKLDVLHAYRTYYKHFGKTYHVQLQLESVVHQGKSLPTVSPLVDANFAAELDTLILSAAHDADLLLPPLSIDATRGGEPFTQLSGVVQSLKPHDMMMADRTGIICTIIYGQDARTPISPTTQRALYVAYAPVGVPDVVVHQHLVTIRDNVLLAAPTATAELMQVFSATSTEVGV